MCEFPGAVTGKKICITNRQLLTGTTEYTAEVRERFLQRLSLIARHHLADGVILREKELSARQYEELAGAAGVCMMSEYYGRQITVGQGG